MQPGDTITPGGGQQTASPSSPPQQPEPAKPAPPPQPLSATFVESGPPASEPPKQPQPSPPPTQQPARPAVPSTQPPASGGEVSWTASEYIAHNKSFGWFVLFGLGTAAVGGVVYLLTRDVISTVATSLVALMFGIFAARQPKVLNYQINHSGVRIGEKFYPFAEFKSFSMQEEGVINSIMLTSMKRFMPGLTMYYPPEHEEQIVDVLADYLPHEEKKADSIDKLMKKVRF